MLLSILLLAGTAFSSALPNKLVLHERRAFEPVITQWTKRSLAPQDAILPVRIALTQRNPQEGHNHLMDISDPRSSNFGKHWTRQQVEEFFSPSSNTITVVREWLYSSGINVSRHKLATSRGHIQFDASVSEVEQLLGTQYDLWEHGETGAQTLSCDSYHVPASIQHHIDFITPTIALIPTTSMKSFLKKRQSASTQVPELNDPKTRKSLLETINNSTSPYNKSHSIVNATCAQRVTPKCIRQLYGIPSNAFAVPGNALGIAEAGDVYDQEDLNLFFKSFAPHIPNNTAPVLQSIDGGTAPVSVENGGAESTLDFEIAYPIIYPQDIKLFQALDPSTAASPFAFGLGDIFLDAIDKSFCTYKGGNTKGIDPEYPNQGYNGTLMCGTYQPTNVISISYAVAEAYYPRSYLDRQCYEFMKLGLKGSSIIFASGDNGTVERSGRIGCLANGTDNPSFPASCPYVTSVGATQIAPGKTTADREVAVDPNNVYSFSSGGGFSNYFPRPSYQDAAVSKYLGSSTRNTSLFNITGRAFPDVSANGWNIETYLNGKQLLNSGTSASAPIFASIINRINGDRITVGKRPLGFLNPTLYAHPHVFNDIVDGYNLGCNAAVGFNATTGWDPVTGLGTPKYADLRKLLLDLP
ncbi:MAG: hypothetical protein GOMPHAMPRED_003229 [Gomphillus americanus]|uniref:tripeptidyl-peptidase II n=1 Tax=Gomphillus americanus TaxID=1940652 RepID=A0A8H3EJ65_9LECA|nr:MAG: hypothetical protein GOMPHAMPRED_003229 [Gomphillus americanus]